MDYRQKDKTCYSGNCFSANSSGNGWSNGLCFAYLFWYTGIFTQAQRHDLA